jgi:hypothetical protein
VDPTAASDPAEPQVVAFLVDYFTAINDHDYQAYVSLLDSQEAAALTPGAFAAEYATTADSAQTLTGIADGSGGSEAAAVTFTSHQSPADSPDGSACDLWSVTLYLVPAESGYVIEHSPPGYSPVVRACLRRGLSRQPGLRRRDGRRRRATGEAARVRVPG